ncbi:MAG: hypothetical protein BM562_08025 [Alphaproteobacteria bacterium MedPE-SWcel]|nr:MAG: hypothetical protein BM562_08025 [Alphaproteobacteria bacterium MedPE-SWcel]
MKLIEKPYELVGHLDSLVAIADNYKTEIGFWPPSSLEDAIWRGRLIAAFANRDGNETVAGFVVFGGVFPNGRIQAVAVNPAFLRQGVAQFLIDNVIAKLESEGYLGVLAKPALDLHVAQKFYEKNNFLKVRTQSGGAARKREIVIRERTLTGPNLLTAMSPKQSLPLLPRTDAQSNLWVIDINVLFDLLKQRRSHYDIASRVFTAALDGRVRIAVTSEFSNELCRSSSDMQEDPLLKLANALPRLRVAADAKRKELATSIHASVFETNKPSQAGSPQALSDCQHLAECIAGNATAFVTSDGVLLRNRRMIRETWGLEVVALDDFHDAIAATELMDDFKPTRGVGFHVCAVNEEVAYDIAKKLHPKGLEGDYFDPHATRTSGHFLAAYGDRQIAIGLLATRSPATLGDAHRVLLLVDHECANAELIADMFLSYKVDAIGRTGLNLINLDDVPGQIAVRKVALQAGFLPGDSEQALRKAALGAPITPASFSALADRTRLAYGQGQSHLFPSKFEGFDDLLKTDEQKFQSIEGYISPTLIAANNRRVSIQPIGRAYADELLGTSPQISLLDQYEGAFRSKKIYVSSGRSKNLFKTNQIIMFYESSRTGGRGAVVAAARVDNVVVQQKNETGRSDMKKTVVESVDRFSANGEVTMTSFSSLLRFPHPVSLDVLQELGAAGTQNLQTATVIATAAAQKIFDRGWASGR